jgi:hypothetical protein
MSQTLPFAEVLDAAEQLEVADQAELVAILTRRLAERGRERVLTTVQEAERDFASGDYRVLSATEIIDEARK